MFNQSISNFHQWFISPVSLIKYFELLFPCKFSFKIQTRSLQPKFCITKVTFGITKVRCLERSLCKRRNWMKWCNSVQSHFAKDVTYVLSQYNTSYKRDNTFGQRLWWISWKKIYAREFCYSQLHSQIRTWSINLNCVRSPHFRMGCALTNFKKTSSSASWFSGYNSKLLHRHRM